MKKIISVLLAVILVSASLCACSKTNESEDNSRITLDSHYSDIGDSTVRAYEKFCTAVINAEPEVKFNTQLFDDVLQLFYTGFPLNVLVENINLSSDRSGVELTYKNDAETHKTIIEEFNARVDEILDECRYKKVSNDRLVFNIYTYLAGNFKIDNEVLTVYDTIMTGSGVPSCINSAFEYLVLISGGEASHLINSIGKGAIVSSVKLSNTYYYFDVAREISKTEGKALRFFAMDDVRIGEYVAGPLKYTDKVTAEPVENTKYSFLDDSQSYTADGDKIMVNCSGKSVQLEIN